MDWNPSWPVAVWKKKPRASSSLPNFKRVYRHRLCWRAWIRYEKRFLFSGSGLLHWQTVSIIVMPQLIHVPKGKISSWLLPYANAAPVTRSSFDDHPEEGSRLRQFLHPGVNKMKSRVKANRLPLLVHQLPVGKIPPMRRGVLQTGHYPSLYPGQTSSGLKEKSLASRHAMACSNSRGQGMIIILKLIALDVSW